MRLTMASKPLHLGWFMNFTPASGTIRWRSAARRGTASSTSTWRKALERACFDYIMIEDTLMVSEAYGGSAEAAHEARAAGAEARSLAAGRDHQRRRRATWAWWRRSPPWPIRRSCWRGCARRWITSPAAGSAGTSSPQARTRRRRISAWTSCRRASSATTMADEYVDLVCQLFEFLGRGRGGDGPRDRHLCGLPQGPADQFRGQILQGARAAEHGALAAGPAGVRAGRRLAARAGVCGETCRLDHRRGQRHRRHEASTATTCAATRWSSGAIRTTSRCCSWSTRSWPRPMRRRRPSASGWCPIAARSSSVRWPASPRSPTSISPSSPWTSRCRI